MTRPDLYPPHDNLAALIENSGFSAIIHNMELRMYLRLFGTIDKGMITLAIGAAITVFLLAISAWLLTEDVSSFYKYPGHMLS